MRDNIIALLEPRLTGVNCDKEALRIVSNALPEVVRISFGARVELRNEFFPTRSYEGIVIPGGYYDALIIELGSGAGDNWWCVIYPPLCFVGRRPGESGITYRSRIWELWQRWFG